jgi:hypothetical protein
LRFLGDGRDEATASEWPLCPRLARRPPNDAVELAPWAVSIVADDGDLIGEHCLLRDLVGQRSGSP